MNPALAPAPELTEAQRAAVQRWGQDVCVVAGPGSGKTRVLIERFRWLVEAQDVAPGRILAVTFTEKAATEIKRRLLDAFPQDGPLRGELERAWVSTIHGFCTRVLKEHAIAARVDPDFRMLDEAQSVILLRRAADGVLDAMLAEAPDAFRQWMGEIATGSADLAAALLELYGEARTAGVPVRGLQPPVPGDPPWGELQAQARLALSDPPGGTVRQRESHRRFHDWCRQVLAFPASGSWQDRIRLLDGATPAHRLGARTRAKEAADQLQQAVLPQLRAQILLRERQQLYPLCLSALARIDAAYRREKAAEGLLDFEDLQEAAIRLLETEPAIAESVRGRFDHVLLDELQDTNRLQWRLIDLLRRPRRLFAVGDVNQSIYFFRHADPSVFGEYRERLVADGAAIDELRDNYRSRGEIIAAVNAIVPFLIDGVEPHRLVARRGYPAKDEPSIEFLHTFDGPESDAVEVEAEWIARRIRQLEGRLVAGKPGQQRPARLADMAILSRTIAPLAVVQEALDRHGIPSVISGGRGFFETREILDLAAWIAVLANPLDELHLLTVLRSPLAGISDETILRLRLKGDDLYTALKSAGPDIVGHERLVWLAATIDAHRRRIGDVPPDQLLAELLDHTSYGEGLPARARANIAKLLALMRERFPAATWPEIQEQLARLRDTHSQPEAAAAEPGDSVRLMSVHAAKGLEFPVVFLAAMRSGAQNRDPAICFDARGTIGLRWRHPADGDTIPDPVYLQVAARKRRQQEAEEDRLLYVALTRAEEHLVLTASTAGQAAWAKRVAEGLGVPAGRPKQPLRERVRLLDGTAIEAECLCALEPLEEPVRPGQVVTPDAIVPPPPDVDSEESVAPVTSIAQHAFCPRQYFLARHLGWPSAAGPEPGAPEPDADRGEFTASEIGTITHQLLAGKLAAAEAPTEAQILAQTFGTSALQDRLRRATRLAHEFDFLAEVEGYILRGQIDLWFEEPDGGIVLVDYKTDRVEKGREFWHGRRYGPQLRLYAIALEKLLGRPVRQALLFYLRTGTQVAVSLAAEPMVEAREQVRAFRRSQAQLDFPLREGAHCSRCAYFGGPCPAILPEPLMESPDEPTS